MGLRTVLDVSHLQHHSGGSSRRADKVRDADAVDLLQKGTGRVFGAAWPVEGAAQFLLEKMPEKAGNDEHPVHNIGGSFTGHAATQHVQSHPRLFHSASKTAKIVGTTRFFNGHQCCTTASQMIENLRFVSESSFGPQGFQVCIGSDPPWRLPVRRKKVEAEPALALFMPHVFPHHRSREGARMVSDFRMERPGWPAPGNRPSFFLTPEQGQRTRSLQNNGLPDHLLIPWQVQKGGISGYHR